jgi:serine/threonine-protein kinase
MAGSKGLQATIVDGTPPPFVPAATRQGRLPAGYEEYEVALGETLAPPPTAVATVAPEVAVAGWGEAAPNPATTLQGRRTTVLPRVQRVDQQLSLHHHGLSRYETDKVLGEGGCGVVEKAMDNDIGRPVAIKRLRPEIQGPAHLARFVEEIQLVGRLEHPNIVPIHDVGADAPGDYYFVMKYVDGESLEQIIAKLNAGDADYHLRYPVERRVEIFIGVLQAIDYAHGRRLVHRDIKPANVMVGPKGEVQVMDWGIARNLDDNEKAAEEMGQLVGTPLYMSPEQAAGMPADERSDIYSLCMLFHELLTLRHPLAEKNSLAGVLLGVATEEVPFASFVNHPHQAPAPAELAWFLAAGLHKDPAKRFPSVAAMLTRLRLRSEGQFPVRCPLTLNKRMARGWMRQVDRHPLLATLFTAAAVLGPSVALLVSWLRH